MGTASRCCPEPARFWRPGCALWRPPYKSIALFAQAPKSYGVTKNKRLLLCARPPLDLSLTAPGRNKVQMNFYKDDRKRTILSRSSGCCAFLVSSEARFAIVRAPDIKCPRLQSQNINDRRTPRQARGHSTRLAKERHFTYTLLRTVGREQVERSEARRTANTAASSIR